MKREVVHGCELKGKDVRYVRGIQGRMLQLLAGVGLLVHVSAAQAQVPAASAPEDLLSLVDTVNTAEHESVDTRDPSPAASAASDGPWALNANDIYNTNSGSIGIGTSTPALGSLFQVNQTATGIGTVSVTAGSGAVTGVGTTFRSTFLVGHSITINSETHTISAIASDTSMTTDNWASTASGQAYALAGGTRFVISQNGNVGIGGSPISSTHLYIPSILNDPPFTVGVFSPMTTNRTIADSNAVILGVYGSSYVGASNTKNWTGPLGPIGTAGLTGVLNGASGTISNTAGLYASVINNSGTATITNAYGLRMHDITTRNGGAITNGIGVAIQNVSAATNNTDLLIGTLTAPTGNYGIYDASSYNNYFGGKVGIGTSTPVAELNIMGSPSSSPGYTPTGGTVPLYPQTLIQSTVSDPAVSPQFSLLVDQQVNSTSDFPGTAWGIASHVQTPSSSTVNIVQETGLVGAVRHFGSGALKFAFGTTGGALVSGSGSIGTAMGLHGGVSAFGSSSITNAYGTQSSVQNRSATGTIGTAASLYIPDLRNDGTITNTYGVYVGKVTAGTQTNKPYSLYASDPDANNYFAGNVGIGTTTPSQKFEVAGNAKISGDLDVSGNLAAKYQDIAEWVKTSHPMLSGVVAILDSKRNNQVAPSGKAYDTRVAGVISRQPGLALGEKSEDKVLVATTGRVKVKVTAANGGIAIGDLLVTSGKAGTAMRSSPVNIAGVAMHRPGTVLGKALEPLRNGEGEILVLLTLQ